MGNCKDCKFWKQQYAFRKTWHTCIMPDLVSESYELEGVNMALYASAADDTDLTVGFKTSALFGCVKFEAIPQTTTSILMGLIEAYAVATSMTLVEPSLDRCIEAQEAKDAVIEALKALHGST